MENKIFECDGNFNTHNSLLYSLFIEIGDYYFSYAVVDELDNLKVICHNHTPIFSDLSNSDILNLPFKQTKISLYTRNFTFLPKNIFDNQYNSEKNNFLNADLENKIYTHTALKNEITILNTYNTQQLNFVKQNFLTAIIYPQFISFIEGVFKQFNDILGVQLFLNLKPNSLEVLIMRDGLLLFYNVFNYVNNDEILYYTLLACKTNKISPEQVTLRLCGSFSLNESLYHQLNSVFADLRLTKTNAVYVNSTKFDTIKAHNFYSLLSLALCE